MPEALQEPFTLTKGDAAVAQADGITPAGWADIFTYTVPVGIGHIILPGHTLACVLWGTDNANMPPTTLVRVTIQDASMQDRKAILGPILYASCQNFTDRDQMLRFNVPEPVKVYERQFIIIESSGLDVTGTVLDVTGAAASESYFELAMTRVRQPL